ncbi:MAG TPA: hypothetical protein VH988_32070 [Thermoanaerobaculia bacterium]|nr:hypothetical protein [Thermoanaerobaculia bacterium]
MREPLNLLGVLLVDAGLAAGFLGLISLLRPLSFLGISTRRRGAVLMAAGAGLGFAGVALPAPEQRAPARTSRLDEIIPVYQFSEFHECRVQASPAKVHDAVWAVTASDIRLFRTLTWIRSPHLGRGGRESILNASAEKPILKVATASGFLLLADEPSEIVVGSLVIAPRQSGVMLAGPQDFAALDAPGFAKAVMNFRIEDEGGGWARLTTETRVDATDASARRRFAAYWRLIYPGSALIRREWLRAIRERAGSPGRVRPRSSV